MPGKSVLVCIDNLHLSCWQRSYRPSSDIRLRKLTRNVEQTSWCLPLSHFYNLELLVPGKSFRHDGRRWWELKERREKRLFNNFFNLSLYLWYSFCWLYLQNFHWKLFGGRKLAYHAFGHVTSHLEDHLRSFGLRKCAVFRYLLEKSEWILWHFQRSSIEYLLLFMLYGMLVNGLGNFIDWNKQAKLLFWIPKISETH